MVFIQEKDRIEIQKRFNTIQQPDKISLAVYNFVIDKEQANKYQIDKIPATIVMGEMDYGIRFYGIPSGYEFSTLLEDIVMVSKKDSGLADDSKTILSKILELI